MTLAVTAAAALILTLLTIHTIDALDQLRKATMSQQDTIDAVVAQLANAKTEIIGRISELQDKIDAGVPAEQLDLTALTAAAQALDDVVPAPATEQPADPAV